MQIQDLNLLSFISSGGRAQLSVSKHPPSLYHDYAAWWSLRTVCLSYRRDLRCVDIEERDGFQLGRVGGNSICLGP